MAGVSGSPEWLERLAGLLPRDAADSPSERRRWALLAGTLASIGPPPTVDEEFPLFARFQEELRVAMDYDHGEALVDSFLNLYAHLHGHGSEYAQSERRVVDDSGGYWGHAGGVSPILKAPHWLRPNSVSIDLGAGNGLQGLLMQWLVPHRLTIQVEISARAIATGRRLQSWLGIDAERIDWRHQDVRDAVPLVERCDLIYLYRPVRPNGPGWSFYEELSDWLKHRSHAVTVLSIADALRPFLRGGFEILHDDGHLTVFRFPAPG